MTAWKLFLTSWDFSPSVVIGSALLLVIYLIFVRFKIDGKTINYTLGVLVIFLALVSPIDTLGDDYLFSAHMLQHMMLGLMAPALLVAGTPEAFVQAWLKLPAIARLEKILSYAPLSLIIANATFWVWHLPVLYNLTLENETVHIFEHLMFLVTGTILWWPVFKPISAGRLTAVAAIVYLGVAAFISTILGIIFTVSDTPYYAGYAHPHDELGALKLIRQDWGLNQLADQKLGGAIMWEPAGAIFLWAIIVVMIYWFKAESQSQFESELEKNSLRKKGERENAGAK